MAAGDHRAVDKGIVSAQTKPRRDGAYRWQTKGVRGRLGPGQSKVMLVRAPR